MVKPGDTIWALAGGHPEIDRRVLVDEIMERNGAGPTLSVGQVLWVPIREVGK